MSHELPTFLFIEVSTNNHNSTPDVSRQFLCKGCLICVYIPTGRYFTLCLYFLTCVYSCPRTRTRRTSLPLVFPISSWTAAESPQRNLATRFQLFSAFSLPCEDLRILWSIFVMSNVFNVYGFSVMIANNPEMQPPFWFCFDEWMDFNSKTLWFLT